VTLRDTKPPIWRRLLMADAMTLADLHRAIQGAMGWHDAHLHLFDIDGRQYGDPRTVDDVADERRLTLGRLLKSGVLRFAYIYDFGDSWEHVIAIEKTRPAIDGETLPACATGKRACPPEDCGGTWGYEHLLEVQADPSHPEYQEQREWIDEESTPRPSTSISPTPFSRPNSAQSKPGRAPSPHADPAYGGWVSNYA
jgi:hypothetical protein